MARAHYQKPQKRSLKPVTTLRGKCLVAWLFSYMAGGAAVSALFFPVMMAAYDDEWPFAQALMQLYGENLFIAILPGLFTSVVYLGPVWLVLRIWISRQKDRDLGNSPATVPVWITVWVLMTVIVVLRAGEDNFSGPPAMFAGIPTPFSYLFNAVILVHMAGVTIMFLAYWRIRPADALDRPAS